jgi:hypothetical protein
MKTLSRYKLNSILKFVFGVILTFILTSPDQAQLAVLKFRNVKLPVNPIAGTYAKHNDTIFLYTGTGGWISQYNPGFPEADSASVLFYDPDDGVWIAKTLVDVTDSLLAVSNPDVTMSISSADILAGTDLILKAGEPGFAFIPTMYFVSFDAGTTQYTGTNNSTLELGTTTIATCGYSTFTSENDTQRRADIFSGDAAGDWNNKAISFDLGDLDTGNGTAIIYVWYSKVPVP